MTKSEEAFYEWQNAQRGPTVSSVSIWNAACAWQREQILKDLVAEGCGCAKFLAEPAKQDCQHKLSPLGYTCEHCGKPYEHWKSEHQEGKVDGQ